MDPALAAMVLTPEERYVLTRLGLAERAHVRKHPHDTGAATVTVLKEHAENPIQFKLVRLCYGHPNTVVVKFTPLGRQVLALIRTQHAQVLKAALDRLALDRHDVQDLLQAGCL